MSLPCGFTKLCQASPSPCLASAPAQEADLGHSKAHEHLKKIQETCQEGMFHMFRMAGSLHMGQLTSRNWKLSRRPVSSNATNYCDCHKNTRPMHQQFLSFRTTQWLLYNTFIGKQATNWQQWSASFAESLGMALISWNWSCRSFIWFLTWQVAQMWQHFVPEVRIKS